MFQALKERLKAFGLSWCTDVMQKGGGHSGKGSRRGGRLDYVADLGGSPLHRLRTSDPRGVRYGLA